MAYEIKNVYKVGNSEFETEEAAKKHVYRLQLRDKFTDYYYHHPIVIDIDGTSCGACKVPEDKAFDWFMKLHEQL